MTEWKYCPEGHIWDFIHWGILYQDYYYCDKCAEIYLPDVKIITQEELNKPYSNDRYKELIDLAKQQQAMRKVTRTDLLTLGYLN